MACFDTFKNVDYGIEVRLYFLFAEPLNRFLRTRNHTSHRRYS